MSCEKCKMDQRYWWPAAWIILHFSAACYSQRNHTGSIVHLSMNNQNAWMLPIWNFVFNTPSSGKHAVWLNRMKVEACWSHCGNRWEPSLLDNMLFSIGTTNAWAAQKFWRRDHHNALWHSVHATKVVANWHEGIYWKKLIEVNWPMPSRVIKWSFVSMIVE